MVSQCFTWFSHGFTWFLFNVSQCFTWFHMRSHGFTRFHIVSQGFTCIHNASHGFTRFHMVDNSQSSVILFMDDYMNDYCKYIYIYIYIYTQSQ